MRPRRLNPLTKMPQKPRLIEWSVFLACAKSSLNGLSLSAQDSGDVSDDFRSKALVRANNNTLYRGLPLTANWGPNLS